ncbi:hypothetical protein JQC67_12180 [Aurantibacter crassamenti]|uniref:hypothetical protein n=1 Tax=Aurantibacter crassamenti TaxID=1837375 RepID=UPI00193A5F33|nr:hypothetical protein [Aurantibacter crassamenti]MBM1106900.1 hypothetical protein [Aurantibacter crassamenti]
MDSSSTNFIKSIVALILVAALQLPVAVKLSHALYEHVDIDCDDLKTVHLHEAEFNCEYQKFHFTTKFVITEYNTPYSIITPIEEKQFSNYFFLSKYQKLHFSLRGPPTDS